MQPNHRSLAFLLSLGSLPLACAKESTDTAGDDSTTASTNNTTGTDGTDPTQASDPTTTGGTTTTGMGQTDTTAVTTEPQPTTFITSDSDTGDTGFETSDDLPPPTDPICIAYGAHWADCFPRRSENPDYDAQYCEYTKMLGMMDGAACVQAFDAYYVCMTMTDCAELDSEDSEPCLKEDAAILMACPSIKDDTDTDTGGFESTSG